MIIDIGTVANPTATATTRTITSVNVAAGTFVFSGTAVAITVNDKVFRQGSGGSGANQKEITGLQTQVAAGGVLWNIDGAAIQPWNAYVDDRAARRAPSPRPCFTKAAQEVQIALR